MRRSILALLCACLASLDASCAHRADGEKYQVVAANGDKYQILASGDWRGKNGDLKVLQALKNEGSDLSKKTDITFYLYIPRLADAESAGAVLTRNGYKVEVREPLGALSDGTREDRYSVLADIKE